MNKVFIATSLDGYIADKEGSIDWLHSIPNPNLDDMGYKDFMQSVDALVMGRTTFETVCGFEIDWPYQKPVFVLSNKLREIPNQYKNKAFLINGKLKNIIEEINQKGFQSLYVDGGATIQSFLKEDLIDEMIITKIPILLGGGTPLFGELNSPLSFKCTKSKIYLDQVVQNHFVRNY